MSTENATNQAQEAKNENPTPVTAKPDALNDLLNAVKQTGLHVLHTSAVPAQTRLFCNPHELLTTLGVTKPAIVFVSYKTLGQLKAELRDLIASEGITEQDTITEITISFNADGVRLAAHFCMDWFIKALNQIQVIQKNEAA
jgi:hypothetical protein